MHKFLCRHAVRSAYHCLFAKCNKPDCSHCSKHPVQAPRFMSFLHLCGGRLFTPTPSPYHDGHYLTYRECWHYLTYCECCLQQDMCRPLLAPDAFLPSGEPQRCDECLNYIFTSPHDQKHMRQVHGGRKRRQQTQGVSQQPTQPLQKQHAIAAHMMAVA